MKVKILPAACSALALILSFGYTALADDTEGQPSGGNTRQQMDELLDKQRGSAELHGQVMDVIDSELQSSYAEVDAASDKVVEKEAALDTARENADVDAKDKAYRDSAQKTLGHALKSTKDAAKPPSSNPFTQVKNDAKKAEIGVKAVKNYKEMKEAESAYIDAAVESADPTEVPKAEKDLKEARVQLESAEQDVKSLETNRQTFEEIQKEESKQFWGKVKEIVEKEKATPAPAPKPSPTPAPRIHFDHHDSHERIQPDARHDPVREDWSHRTA